MVMMEYIDSMQKTKNMNWLRGFVSSSMRMDQAVMQYARYQVERTAPRQLCVEAR